MQPGEERGQGELLVLPGGRRSMLTLLLPLPGATNLRPTYLVAGAGAAAGFTNIESGTPVLTVHLSTVIAND